MAGLRDNQFRGCKGLVYAHVTEDTEENYTTGEVKPFARVKSISRTFEQSSETVFADDQAIFVTTSAGVVTRTFETLAIDDGVLADVTGQFSEESSGLVINKSSATPPYIAIGYIVSDTDNSEYYVWAYKCKVQTPETTSATKDNGTESAGQSVTIDCVQTVHKFTKNSDGAVDLCVPKDTAGYDVSTFFDAVTTPDNLVAKS